MPSLYYPSFNLGDLDEYLEAFAKGEDPEREARLAAAPQFIYNNDGQTGKRVVEYLYQELFVAERELVEELSRSVEEKLQAKKEAEGRLGVGLLKREAARVSEVAQKLKEPQVLTFALLADTHYTRDGMWADTAASLRLVHQDVGFNRIIHLGDLTSGTTDLYTTRAYVEHLYEDFKLKGAPLRVVIGECDSNGTNRNPEQLTVLEQSRLYLKANKPYYYEDIKSKHLRLIFLNSFDVERSPEYGYSEDCIEWLRLVFEDTPPARRVIVFSHLPPVARLLNGADSANGLYGESELMEVLNSHASHILGFIHGHNHEDYLDNEEAFPIVSIASASYDHVAHATADEPVGDGVLDVPPATVAEPDEPTTTAKRESCDITRECWDVLLADPTLDTLRFIRFGAGSDRIVENGEARWL
jgi:predicted phosphodiesterase